MVTSCTCVLLGTYTVTYTYCYLRNTYCYLRNAYC